MSPGVRIDRPSARGSDMENDLDAGERLAILVDHLAAQIRGIRLSLRDDPQRKEDQKQCEQTGARLAMRSLCRARSPVRIGADRS